MEKKVTEIKAWCPTCKGVVKHVDEMIIVNGSVTFSLECGHTIKEHFPLF